MGIKWGKLSRKSFDSEVILVKQSYYGYARYERDKDSFKRIGTIGCGPCVGLAMWNENNSTGLIAHFDSDNAPVINDILTQLLNIVSPTLAAVVTTSENEKSTMQILSAIENKIKLDIQGSKLQTDLCLNLQRGIMTCTNNAYNAAKDIPEGYYTTEEMQKNAG